MVFLGMGVNKIVITTTVGLLLLVALIYSVAERKVDEIEAAYSPVKIQKTWKLPKILAEISGLAYLEEDKVVAVQDEQGKLYIYNLSSEKIEKEIGFAGRGDYEEVAIHEDAAYVLLSDGSIIKIDNYLSSPEVSTIETSLNQDADTESLCLDKKNKRLLIGVKEEDPSGGEIKGIYALPLNTLKMQAEPIFGINMNDTVFKDIRGDKAKNTFKPSGMNIHPKTGEIYIVDGAESRLLILDAQGNPRQLYFLNKEEFPQPEGLTFDASGNLFISSEGSPGSIHRVSLN